MTNPCDTCKSKKYCKGCPSNPSVRQSRIVLEPISVTVHVAYSGSDPSIEKMCEDINKALERRRKNGYVIKGKIDKIKICKELPIKPKEKFSRRKSRKGRKD